MGAWVSRVWQLWEACRISRRLKAMTEVKVFCPRPVIAARIARIGDTSNYLRPPRRGGLFLKSRAARGSGDGVAAGLSTLSYGLGSQTQLALGLYPLSIGIGWPPSSRRRRPPKLTDWGSEQSDPIGRNPNCGNALNDFRNAPEIIDSHQSRLPGIVLLQSA